MPGRGADGSSCPPGRGARATGRLYGLARLALLGRGHRQPV